MKDLYKKLAVLGHPIKQSKSPLIHNYWIEKYGRQGKYGAIDLNPDTFKHDLGQLISEEYSGFNVTSPHKQTIKNYCDYFDNAAIEIGAINTITIKDNKMHGSNTDAYGFIQNLENECPNFDWTAGPAVILGAGGAARAIAYALKEKNVPVVRVCNRTVASASDIVADMGGYVVPWCDREKIISDCNLLINTTSLGMDGKPSLDMSLQDLSRDACVYDIVYAPLMTPLLLEAQARGNNVVTGIGMLLYQAQKAFETWYGILPEIDKKLIQNVLK
jgi:shikimate dehydrogenase